MIEEFKGQSSPSMQSFLQSIRCGASIWTTFRFISGVIFAFCWIIALPVELVLNRKMGRRYTGFLPLFGAYIVMHFVFIAALPQRSWMGVSMPSTGAEFGPLLMFLVMGAAIVRHRFASWWRFRSHEQVHSFSNGVPFWLHPPKVLVNLVPSPKPSAAKATSTKASMPKPPPDANAPLAKKIEYALVAFADFLIEQVPSVFREWRSGEIPTGPITWMLATIAHPAMLFGSSIPVSLLNAPMGSYLMFAAVAIFLKARIQKAMIVETVYDLFDARIEHSFTQSLANPEKLRDIERTGLAVPGIARALGEMEPKGDGRPDGRGTLAPDLAALLATPTLPVVVKPQGNNEPSAGDGAAGAEPRG